ncbi:MAG: hypothetical protein AAFY65_01290 [Pseudomonadota bacterium]
MAIDRRMIGTCIRKLLALHGPDTVTLTMSAQSARRLAADIDFSVTCQALTAQRHYEIEKVAGETDG